MLYAAELKCRRGRYIHKNHSISLAFIPQEYRRHRGKEIESIKRIRAHKHT